jgi:hypothetical protein
MIGHDVLTMARHAGMMNTPIGQIEKLYAMAVAAEREACAKLIDANASACNGLIREVLDSQAQAIRSRT